MAINNLDLFKPVFDTDPESSAGGAPGSEAPAGAEDEQIQVSKSEYDNWQSTKKILGDNFDGERYSKIKDIDPAEYASMKSFVDIVDGNEEVYDVVKEMLTAKREGRPYDFSGFTKQAVSAAKEAVKAPGAPANLGKEQKPGIPEEAQKRLNALESKFEQQEVEKFEKQFSDKFEETCSSLGKMTQREKSILRQAVEKAIIDDEKLTLKDVANVVKDRFEKELKPFRQELIKEYAGKAIDESDESPESLGGGSPAIPGKSYDPSKATSNERVSQFSQELRAGRQ